jgi:hypothetical protein
MDVSHQLHAPAALPPRKQTRVPILQEAVWAPEPVWTLWSRDKSLSLVENAGESSASCPGCFAPEETDSGTHCIGGCVPVWRLWSRDKSLSLAENGTRSPPQYLLSYRDSLRHLLLKL